LGFIYWRL